MASHAAFSVCLDVVIRPCREDDLPALEWFGLFRAQRPLIQRVFEQQARGEAMILVAQANGEPSGQLWIELEARKAERVGLVWALRVLPCLQRLGLGAHLLAGAEELLLELGFACCALAVETDDPAARQWYERHGYRLTGTRLAAEPAGVPQRGLRMQWVLAKDLGALAGLALGSEA